MEKIIVRKAKRTINVSQPTEKEFWEWTNKRRHEFIKQDFSGNFKAIYRNIWAYLFYRETDLCIRFQVDKKKQILKIETYQAKEGLELSKLTDAAIHAFNNFN